MSLCHHSGWERVLPWCVAPRWKTHCEISCHTRRLRLSFMRDFHWELTLSGQSVWQTILLPVSLHLPGSPSETFVAPFKVFYWWGGCGGTVVCRNGAGECCVLQPGETLLSPTCFYIAGFQRDDFCSQAEGQAPHFVNCI